MPDATTGNRKRAWALVDEHAYHGVGCPASFGSYDGPCTCWLSEVRELLVGPEEDES